MRVITAKELKSKLDKGEDVKLLNALEKEKFEAAHIPGSLKYLYREEIENNIRKEEEVVVYCADYSCNKSILMYQLLDAMGYKNVARFAGGLVEWEREGFPLEGSKAN